jgi:hypothetical protein
MASSNEGAKPGSCWVTPCHGTGASFRPLVEGAAGSTSRLPFASRSRATQTYAKVAGTSDPSSSRNAGSLR